MFYFINEEIRHKQMKKDQLWELYHMPHLLSKMKRQTKKHTLD